VTVEAEEIAFANLLDMVARPFRHEAETRQLSFEVSVDPNLGRSITTDSKRLQQILKNLLSNAFKFTSQGGVRLRVAAVQSGWSAAHPVLKQTSTVVAFEVSDTGIGIPEWRDGEAGRTRRSTSARRTRRDSPRSSGNRPSRRRGRPPTCRSSA
jgi:signal transduction histidine kinase